MLPNGFPKIKATFKGTSYRNSSFLDPPYGNPRAHYEASYNWWSALTMQIVRDISLILPSHHSSQPSLTWDKNNYHRPAQNHHIKMPLSGSTPKEAITKNLESRRMRKTESTWHFAYDLKTTEGRCLFNLHIASMISFKENSHFLPPELTVMVF